MTPPGVRYVVDTLMGFPGWEPRCESFAMLDRCDSQLERMCALGLVYRSEENWAAAMGEKMPPAWGSESWSFVDPWMLWPGQIGPSELKIHPQVKHGRLTRDFVIAFNGEDVVNVEADGFNTHRNRRRQDWMRDQHAVLPTVRYLEELEPPIEWPSRLFWPWESKCTHCALPLGEHTPCPPF